MEDQEIYEQIEAYLLHRMTEQQRLVFEHQLSQDPSLVQEVQTVKALHEIVRTSKDQMILNTLKQFREEETLSESRQDSGISRNLYGWRVYAIAATVVLLLGIGWLFRSQIFLPSHQQIFEEYHQAYRAPIVVRGEKQNSIWMDIRDAYVEQAYETAVKLLLSEKNESTPYLTQFYLGQSLLAQEDVDPKLAIEAFAEVLSMDNDYHAQSLWYTALAWIKLGETEQAKATLEQLISIGTFQMDQAEVLLDRL
ncbi:MAG: tetratricopeptide repeat protein [Bacteroidota bacterium]